MIYHTIWSYLTAKFAVTQWNIVMYPGKRIGEVIEIPRLKELAEFIKSSENDSFLFVLVKSSGQWDEFDAWIEREKLKDYIRVETKGITNPIHPDRKYNLKLVVLQSLKHFQRDEEAAEAAKQELEVVEL